MVVAVAGAHGKIALRLAGLLASRGDSVIGLIRNPEHAADVRQAGASPVVCDLEGSTVEEIARHIEGADAAVFAAGAGRGSGAARKLTMDRDGAVKLLQAATAAGVRRYLIISAVGAGNPPNGDDVFSVYLRAKAQADDAVRGSDRDWTILRPGGLTDDPGRGLVRIDSESFNGRIPRDDVAEALVRVLDDPRAFGRVLYLNGGSEPIEQAVEGVLATGR
jgi:nucleoside-diphosphate-sugar epimerase